MTDAWLLMTFGVPDRLVALCNRLGMRPTKKKPQNWWRKFDGRPEERDQAKSVQLTLKRAGLQTKWIAVQHDGKEITDLQTIRSETAKELRLAQEALKRAHETRRQAERAAERDTHARATDAVRRARGDNRPGDYSRRREPPAP